ncbi:MAG TPA: methyltransferase [Terriglobales bacterium]
MKATRFEFRFRFFIIGLIFWLAFFWTGAITGGHFGQLWIQLSGWMSHADGLSNDANAMVLRVFVSALVIAAAWLRTWAAAYLHSSVVHDANLHVDRVVAVGPFARMRNPLYLATLLLAIAMAFMNAPVPALLLVLSMTVFLLRLTAREEGELAAAQGESYLRYKAAVPRFWPFGRRSVQGASVRAEWGQALLGELWFWGFAAAVIAYAFTFNLLWFGRVFIVGLGLYLIMRAVMPRRAPVAHP